MTKYLKDYIKYIKKILAKAENKTDWQAVLAEHRVKIGFFQHERLMHLLVTLFFGLLFILIGLIVLILIVFSEGLFTPIIMLLLLELLLLIVLISYIFHYFFLENGVQELYRIDEKIVSKSLTE